MLNMKNLCMNTILQPPSIATAWTDIGYIRSCGSLLFFVYITSKKKHLKKFLNVFNSTRQFYLKTHIVLFTYRSVLCVNHDKIWTKEDLKFIKIYKDSACRDNNEKRTPDVRRELYYDVNTRRSVF